MSLVVSETRPHLAFVQRHFRHIISLSLFCEIMNNQILPFTLPYIPVVLDISYFAFIAMHKEQLSIPDLSVDLIPGCNTSCWGGEEVSSSELEFGLVLGKLCALTGDTSDAFDDISFHSDFGSPVLAP